MSKRRTGERSGRRLRRWIVAGIVGLLIAGLAILFLVRIYNPFGPELPEVLALVPDDVDFAVSIASFPEFVGRIRERPFIRTLDRSPGFEAFLETPYVREKGVMDALRKAFQALDGLRGRLPFGLDLLGDLSGSRVALAGYYPSGDQGYRFMLVFRPDDWKAVAGANVLLDETLCGMLVEDRLGGEVQLEHERDLVRITIEGEGQTLHLARVADAIVVSTEGRQLARILKAVDLQGIPTQAHPRFTPLVGGIEVPSQVRLVTRRAAADEVFRIERTLLDRWGPEKLDLARSVLPAFGGEDVVVTLDVDQGLVLSVAGTEVPRPESIASLLKPFPKEELERAVARIGGLCPDSSFGFVYLRAAPGLLVKALLERPDIMPTADLELLSEELREIRAFGGREGLYRFFDEVAEERVALAFFTQPRATLPDRYMPGYALILPLRNEARAREAFAEIHAATVRRQGQGGIGEMNTTERDGATLYQFVLKGGVVDDPELTIPGAAILRGHLIVTNYHPGLAHFLDAAAGRSPALAADPALERTLLYAPRDLRLAALISHRALTPYLDQSAGGWATSQTKPTQVDQQKKRAEVAGDVTSRGLVPGTAPYEQEVDRRLIDWLETEARVRRPKIEREIRDHIEYFRGLAEGVGVFVEQDVHGFALTLRVDLAGSEAGPR